MSRGVYRPRVGADNQTPPTPPTPAPTPGPPKRNGDNGLWWKLAIAGGLGVAGYMFVWPAIRRRIWPSNEVVIIATPPEPVAVVTMTTTDPSSSVISESSPVPAVEQFARDRGFSSVSDYENSVLLNARQLHNAGADITFAPHQAHLAGKLAG